MLRQSWLENFPKLNMAKDQNGFEITEGFIQDHNKNVIIELKKQALISLGIAEAMPNVDFVRLAYGTLNSFCGSLTHQDFKSSKEFLEAKRAELLEMGYILNGHDDSLYLSKLRHKYHVNVVQTRVGVRSMHGMEFKNLSYLVSRMRTICTELVEYAQKTGFGSAKAANRIYGGDRIMDAAGLDPRDIGAE
jgi:hypothetical protein